MTASVLRCSVSQYICKPIVNNFADINVVFTITTANYRSNALGKEGFISYSK